MKNYRLAISLLALFTIFSVAFTTTSQNTDLGLFSQNPEKSSSTTALASESSSSQLPAYREIEVDSVQELMWTVDTCKDGNVTILIADGTYNIPNGLWITANHITYKSKSGNRDKVILQGQFKTSHIFWIAGNHVTLQDISLGQVTDNGVQILGEKNAEHTLIKNLRFFDIKEHMIKGSGTVNDAYSNDTRIEDCLFEFTSGKAYQSFSGGISIRKGKQWILQNNTFKNIQTLKGPKTEGAIYIYDDSSDMQILGNTILNCDQGIILGSENQFVRNIDVSNNKIITTNGLGVYLCNATNTLVKGNTISVPDTYPNSIEYRYKTDGSIIENNTVNKDIISLNGGKAKVSQNIFK